MASFVYYLAKHPEFQVRARKEAEAALKKDQGEPTVENLREMPFIQACIREALRLNTPIVSDRIYLCFS
jgi:cytochrome P450